MKLKVYFIISAWVIVFSGCSTRKESTFPQVTIPNGSTPVKANAPHAPMNDNLRDCCWNYGNGALWVVIPQDGVFTISDKDRDKDGYYHLKMPWWRGVKGEVTVTGRRLDLPAPPLRFRTASVQENGDIGFLPCVLSLPSGGYWEITASIAGKSLTLVIHVTKEDE